MLELLYPGSGEAIKFSLLPNACSLTRSYLIYRISFPDIAVLFCSNLDESPASLAISFNEIMKKKRICIHTEADEAFSKVVKGSGNHTLMEENIQGLNCCYSFVNW